MQLPQLLQHFSRPTLLVRADHIHAEFWMAHDAQLDRVDTFALPREWKSDNETIFVNTNHGGSRTFPELSDEDRMQKYVKEIAIRIEDAVRHAGVEQVRVLAVTEIERGISNMLAHDIQSKIGQPVHADLLKEDILKSVERLF